jgi:hypothetical protein
VKALNLTLALAAALGLSAVPAYGQYSTSNAPYRAPVYAPPVQTAAVPMYAAPGTGSRQFTASRPMPSGYGLQSPAAVGPATSFRPVNAPSSATQRVLVANRTPTPAPPAVKPVTRTASQPIAPPAQTMWQPSMNAQDWSAPTPSMPYGGQQYGGPQYGGAPGGYAGGSAPMPAGDAPLDYSYSGAAAAGGACGCDGGAVGGGACGTGCGGCGLRRGCGLSCCCLSGHTCCIPFKTTGDLVQHMPFFGTTHGYYYFRPYHVMHVFSQQELATRWGGDPRNPYDNSGFQRIYEQNGVAAQVPAVPALPTQVVTPAQEYVLPNSTTTAPFVPGQQYAPAPQYVPGAAPTPVPMKPEYVPAPGR